MTQIYNKSLDVFIHFDTETLHIILSNPGDATEQNHLLEIHEILRISVVNLHGKLCPVNTKLALSL